MPFPSVGGASFVTGKGPKVIRLALHGHANRPFYHIVLTNSYIKRDAQPVEQLGTYDPMPNKDNQKLISLNVDRTRYWMGQGAIFSRNLAQVLGLVGFLHIHPETYMKAWRIRHKAAQDEVTKAAEPVEKSSPTPPSSSSASG